MKYVAAQIEMRSIREKLFMLLIVMGSIPLIIVLIAGAVSMVNELEEETHKEGLLRNSVVSEHVTELCEKNFHVLHTLALNPLIKEYVRDQSSIPRIRISELLHQTNDIFSDQNIMALTGADAMQIMRTDGSDLVNLITRQHFKEAMKGRDFVSNIIVSMSTGKMIVVLEVPIKNDKGQPIGMLQRNFNMIELQYFVKELDDKKNSVIVIDREGRIIANSDKIFESAAEYLEDGSYKVISEKVQEDEKTAGIIRMSINGEDSLVSYSRNYITGWIILVIKPYHYILDEVYFKIAQAVFLGLIMLTIVSTIAHRLAYRATKPIIEITQAADKIAHGNNSVEKIEISSDDEISQMAEAFNKIRTLRDTYQLASEVDKLTKLYNKTTTENICKLKLKEYELTDQPRLIMAFFIIDLDHFKRVNDTLGHQFGDKILVEFSKRIRRIFRPNDCVGRFGGDEFIVIVENLPSTEIVVRKAENIKKIAAELTIDGIDAGVTASIGIAIVPPEGTDYDTLFKTADDALYSVKKMGRNDYCIIYMEKNSIGNGYI